MKVRLLLSKPLSTPKSKGIMLNVSIKNQINLRELCIHTLKCKKYIQSTS